MKYLSPIVTASRVGLLLLLLMLSIGSIKTAHAQAQTIGETACLLLKTVNGATSFLPISFKSVLAEVVGASCSTGSASLRDTLRTCDLQSGITHSCRWATQDPYKDRIEEWLEADYATNGYDVNGEQTVRAQEQNYMACLWTVAQFGVDHWSLGWNHLRCVTETRTKPRTSKPPSTTSLESDRNGLSRLYQAYFKRHADREGLLYWLEMVRNHGWSLSSVSNHFANSHEYYLRYGNTGNYYFVRQVYRSVLGRSPDSAGLRYWLGRLNRGELTRGRLFLYFTDSPEYRMKTGLPGKRYR